MLVPCLLALAQASAPDFAHDLGVGVRDVQPLARAPSTKARARVAELVGCPPEELSGIRLFSGRVTPASGPERAEELVFVPLAGPAQGGRLLFSASQGRAREIGLWGALDFDADPTARWGLFLEQVRDAPTHMTGDGPAALSRATATPASELEGRLGELAHATEAEGVLERALLRQRLVMRRNGMALGIVRGRVRPPPEWMEELASEMDELARAAPILAPLLGADSGPRYAEHARALAGIYGDMASLLRGDPESTLAELAPPMLQSCSTCHRAVDAAQGNKKWQELADGRRGELELTGTQLWLGFDVAPALGDDGAVSRELARKVRAGLLLLEAARE